MNGVKAGEPVPIQVQTHQKRILELEKCYSDARAIWIDSEARNSPDYRIWEDILFSSELIFNEYIKLNNWLRENPFEPVDVYHVYIETVNNYIPLLIEIVIHATRAVNYYRREGKL
ncbi:MAG: hypothetical protein AAF655_12580 [Bacteroidota bacterium]